MISTTRNRWARGLMLACLSFVLTACGGDDFRNRDDDGNSGNGGNNNSTPAVNSNTPAAVNVVPIVIDGGPTGRATNVPFVTLTVCTPGSTTQCQTLNHILLDTGSTGLRLVSSVLSSTIAPASYNNAAGEPLAECFAFVDGTVWGRLRTVDVVFGNERLSSVPMQMIGDQAGATLPNDCSGPMQNTVETFGANGILGISTFVQDCGESCALSAQQSLYYRCPASGCVRTTVAVANQVHNPVSQLPADNNGVVVTMPAVPETGARTATGALILGINTRANNQLPATASVLTLNPANGYLTASYGGATLTNSFFDTGSNFYFFNDSTLPICTAASYSRFYCPLGTQNRSASVTGANGRSTTVNFKLVNVQQTFTRYGGNDVFDGFGATTTLGSSFDFGAPFYFGRSVFTAFEGEGGQPNAVGGANGPWIAF